MGFAIRHVNGLTLIQLMITVAIIGILATIALPNYSEYILRGQIVDATNGLAAMQANMERHFQDNRTYATSGTFASPCLTGTAASRTVGLSDCRQLCFDLQPYAHCCRIYPGCNGKRCNQRLHLHDEPAKRPCHDRHEI